MNKFLKSIGFSDFNREDVEKLIKKVDKDAQIITFCKLIDNTEYEEKEFEIADNIGIKVCGYYRKGTDEFVPEYYFPFLNGTNISTKEKVEFERYYDKEALCGICDEVRMGVTLIFYVQNMLSCTESIKEKRSSKGTYLAGLAESGRILLPIVQKSKKKASIKNSSEIIRDDLIAKAREGDESAVEDLMQSEIDTYSNLTQRVKSEDILSIVSTSIIPYGVEPDIYNVLGNIVAIRKEENSITKEKIYVMKIEANRIIFDLCINEKDLLGEPKVGRRFKGKVWLQGRVCFSFGLFKSEKM